MMNTTMSREQLERELAHVEFMETQYTDMAVEIEQETMFNEVGENPELENKYWEYVNKAEECYDKKMELRELLNNM